MTTVVGYYHSDVASKMYEVHALQILAVAESPPLRGGGLRLGSRPSQHYRKQGYRCI